MVVCYYDELIWVNSKPILMLHAISRERAKEDHLEKFEVFKRPKCRNTGSSNSYFMVTSDYTKTEAFMYIKIPISSGRISENVTRFLAKNFIGDLLIC